MNQPQVVLSDYLIFIECVLFVWLLARLPATVFGTWFIMLFGLLAVASLAGGTVHGFAPPESTPLFDVLWLVVLLSIGLASVALWAIAARLLFSEPMKDKVIIAASWAFIAYVAVVVTINNTFLMAILFSTLPALVLFVAFFVIQFRSPERAYAGRVGASALGLNFWGSIIQQLQIGYGPLHHNTVYHLIEAVSFGALFICAWHLIQTDERTS